MTGKQRLKKSEKKEIKRLKISEKTEIEKKSKKRKKGRKMAKMIYVGMFDAVDVDLPTGGSITCKNGEVSNLPDSLAKSLLEQKENWKEAKEKKGDDK